MYADYARRSHDAWPTRPLLWLLEGDYVQYAGQSQKNALSYTELGKLAADTACAIESNMPNAVVAINHSTWNPDAVTHCGRYLSRATPLSRLRRHPCSTPFTGTEKSVGSTG